MISNINALTGFVGSSQHHLGSLWLPAIICVIGVAVILLNNVKLLNSRVADAAVGALAADTAILLDESFGTGLQAGFLAKQIKVHLSVSKTLSTPDTLILGFANGSATVAEIVDALHTVQNDPNDATQRNTRDNWMTVWWETLQIFGPNNANEGNDSRWNAVIKIGGGKGIPMLEEKGVQLFAYNPGAGAIGATTVAGLYAIMGAWLSD